MSKYTKERLIETAKELFSQKGYHETRVSDIVKKADVAQGTFYFYFKSKEDLFLNLIRKLHQELLEKLSKYTTPEGSIEETIDNLIVDFLSEVYKNKEIAQIFFGQLLGINEEFRELYIQKISDIQNILHRVLNNYLDPDTSQLLSTMILGFLRQLFFNCLINKNFNLEHMIKRAKMGVSIILRSVEMEGNK
ncbi:MAG: TetR/AcrR family transcriptional regulator [Hydrogenothermaceae bacterium]|nr:TetR/AcrR family transcriptional regulator [Hydrogenothermaceae bacterium]